MSMMCFYPAGFLEEARMELLFHHDVAAGHLFITVVQHDVVGLRFFVISTESSDDPPVVLHVNPLLEFEP